MREQKRFADRTEEEKTAIHEAWAEEQKSLLLSQMKRDGLISEDYIIEIHKDGSNSVYSKYFG